MSEAPQKKGTSWSIGIGLGIAALLIGTAILTDPSVSGSAGEKDKAAAGTVEPLHLQTNTLAISAPGIVKASHLTMLSPGVSGKVDKVHPLFSAGEIVLKGTPLLELEKFEYRARLANAQAGLEQARLDVSTEQAEALKAIKKTYSSVSKSGKESELVLRVPQRRAVNARLNAAEAYVAEAEQALRDTVLEAPYTCQVVECSVGAGARVVAGQPVGKVIPLQERMIRVPVPLEEFSALPRDEQGRVSTALTASCVLNNGKRPRYGGGRRTGYRAQFRRADSLPGAERLPCFRMAGGPRQHGPSGEHQRAGPCLRVDSRLCRPGWKLHSGKNRGRDAGAQGARGGVERRESPGNRSGITGRGRFGSLIFRISSSPIFSEGLSLSKGAPEIRLRRGHKKTMPPGRGRHGVALNGRRPMGQCPFVLMSNTSTSKG